jgi:hypothetical protein
MWLLLSTKQIPMLEIRTCLKVLDSDGDLECSARVIYIPYSQNAK